ncbi:MAG: hypothetical protein WDO56_00065 [Gammaproteobacteria bacterium]
MNLRDLLGLANGLRAADPKNRYVHIEYAERAYKKAQSGRNSDKKRHPKLFYSAKAFEAQFDLDQSKLADQLTLEKQYLILFRDICLEACVIYRNEIEATRQRHADSIAFLKRQRIVHTYRPWDKVCDDMDTVIDEFVVVGNEVDSLALKDVEAAWIDHHRILRAAIEQSQDLLSDVEACIRFAEERRMKARENRLAKAGFIAGVAAALIAGAQFAFDFGKDKGGGDINPPRTSAAAPQNPTGTMPQVPKDSKTDDLSKPPSPK